MGYYLDNSNNDFDHPLRIWQEKKCNDELFRKNYSIKSV